MYEAIRLVFDCLMDVSNNSLVFHVLMDVSHNSLVSYFDECLAQFGIIDMTFVGRPGQSKDHPRAVGGPLGDTGQSVEIHLGKLGGVQKKRKPRIWHKFWEIEVLVVTTGSGRRNQYEKTEPQAQM